MSMLSKLIKYTLAVIAILFGVMLLLGDWNKKYSQLFPMRIVA